MPPAAVPPVFRADSRSFVASSSQQRWRCAASRTGRAAEPRAADVHCERASRVEATAARRIEQRRRLAGDLGEPLDLEVQARQRAEQPPRVGMLRAVEDLVDVSRARRPGRRT